MSDKESTMDDTLTPAELHDLLARSRAERNALRAEVERLRGALTVLVAPANGYDGIPPRKYFGDTDFELRYPDDLIIEVQLGALRKARASLNGGKTDG
jgi:hypothetical protein